MLDFIKGFFDIYRDVILFCPCWLNHLSSHLPCGSVPRTYLLPAAAQGLSRAGIIKSWSMYGASSQCSHLSYSDPGQLHPNRLPPEVYIVFREDRAKVYPSPTIAFMESPWSWAQLRIRDYRELFTENLAWPNIAGFGNLLED